MLAELTLPKMAHRVNVTAAYHDACHLAHAQRVCEAPRELLSRIEGLKLVPLAENDLCCGAAGTYNLENPKMADELANRKLDHLAAAKAEVPDRRQRRLRLASRGAGEGARTEAQGRASGGADSPGDLRDEVIPLNTTAKSAKTDARTKRGS